VSLASTRADLVRAVLEGVAYNNHWLHGYVEKFAGQRLDPIRVVGGGAQSDLWCQIHADVMDRTIEQVADPLHAQLRGAAVLAGMSLGLVDRAEVRDLVSVANTFRPDPDTRAVYARLSAELPRLYASQRKMFRRLNGRWSCPAPPSPRACSRSTACAPPSASTRSTRWSWGSPTTTGGWWASATTPACSSTTSPPTAPTGATTCSPPTWRWSR